MSGGDSGSQTTTTNPWQGQQQYLTDIYRQAAQNYQNPPQYFPGSTVVPFSGQTEQALSMQEQRALNGSPVESGFSNYLTGALNQPNIDPTNAAQGANQLTQGIGAGQYGLLQQQQGGSSNPFMQALQGGNGLVGANQNRNFLGDAPGSLEGSQNYVNQLLGQDPTLQGSIGDINSMVNTGLNQTAQNQLRQTAKGNYLNDNPFLDDMLARASEGAREQFSDSVIPGLNATFGSSGRTGSSIHGETFTDAAGELGDTLGNMATDIYGQNYQQERNRQLNAAGQLGQLGLASNAQTLDAAGLGASIYNQDAQRQFGGAQLGGDLFSRGSSDQLARGETSLNSALNQNALGANLYNQGENRALSASQGLMQGGIGGLGATNDMFSSIDQSQFRAGSVAPSQVAMDYQNIDRLMQTGQITEEQAGNYLQDMIDRFSYYENLPNQQLGQYSSVVQAGFPGSQTSTPGVKRNRAVGALGGAAAGAYIGSVVPGLGTAVGAGIGAIGGAFL